MRTISHNIALKCLAAAILAAPAISAQNLQSGYFDNNYLYRYQANPAMGNDGHGFVSMPTLGNLNVTMQGTLGIDDVLYNINGKTTTFLNPEVDAASFLSNINAKNRVGASIRENILAVGFKGIGGYNTVTLSARADIGVYLPGDLLRLAKEGATNASYNIGNAGARIQSWTEVALNHSHQIDEHWRVGGAFKLLVGLGNIEAKFNQADLTLGEDNWTASVDAQINASVKDFYYEHDFNDNTNREYVSGCDIDEGGINGVGVAFDLGAVYTINSDWEVSASLLDLGFINWDNNMLATTNGRQTVETDKYSFNVDDDSSFDKLKDDLSMLYQLEDAGDQGSRTTGLGTTLNLAAKYTLPAYRNLSFGLLNTTRIQGDYSWTDFRLSANVNPAKCFSAGVNLGLGTFGFSFGWIVNFKVTGFNLFLASDCTPTKLAKQGVPLSSNANINLGINFPF